MRNRAPLEWRLASNPGHPDNPRTMRSRRPPFLRVLFAFVFALVLPVAASHCATMSLRATSDSGDSAMGMRADHSCCVSGTRAGDRAMPVSESDCVCVGLPSATAPSTLSLDAPDVLEMAILLAAALNPPTLPSLPRTPRSSEPPLVVCEANGLWLRGPPAQG